MYALHCIFFIFFSMIIYAQMYFIFLKVCINFQKRMYIQRCYFFSQIFIGECIYKIFSITMYVQKGFFPKKNIKFFIYVQNLEIFKWGCIYKNIQCVYVSCNHYMLTSFFCKKNDWFFCIILFHIFLREKKNLKKQIYLLLSFYGEVKTLTWQCQEGLKWICFLKKWGWGHKRIKRVSK